MKEESYFGAILSLIMALVIAVIYLNSRISDLKWHAIKSGVAEQQIVDEISGEVEFVSGNHVSTYAARARGDTWVYLGQTVSWNNIKLITREDIGINSLYDVRYRKFGSKGRHPGLNAWLYLKQHGLDPLFASCACTGQAEPFFAHHRTA